MRDASPESLAFGRTLRKQRRDRELSQDALAHFSGISAKHIGEIERSTKEPRITTAVRLIGALRLPLGDFFALVEERLGDS